MWRNIVSVFLKAFTGLACVLAGISYAQSDNREIFSSSLNASSSPNDVIFRRNFAKSIHKIIEDGLDVKKISKEFDWKILEEKKFEETGTTVSTFDLYRRRSNPRLIYYPKVKKSSLIAQLAPEYICLRSEDVISEFGKNFKPALLNVDSWKDSSSLLPRRNLSEAVKKNWELFSWGPMYEIHLNDQIYSVIFLFYESECTVSLSIYQQD